MRFRTLAEWLAWQDNLHPRTIDLGLERVQRVAATLGIAAFDIHVITVGGTNGKGSCVAMLESILCAAGYAVGAFTSPHLIRYNERIRIDGLEISDAKLMAAFERIDAARAEVSLTFFEFNTLAALLAFREAELDAIVLEVGLGGRLDAVNVLDADVALLVSVGMDHCDYLGDTLEAIGYEKAGIFRSDRPAVLGSADMPHSVRTHAQQVGALLREPGVHYSYSRPENYDAWSWSNARVHYQHLPPPESASRAVLGIHQFGNAAAVLAVLEELRDRLPVSRDAIDNGLRNLDLPGRLQWERPCREPSDPEWVFDVAHNPDAAQRLADTLTRLPMPFSQGGRQIAVVGILKDKDAPATVAPLRGIVDRWIAVDLPGPRGLTGFQLREACGAVDDQSWSTAPDVVAGCKAALAIAGEDDRIVVFGSFHTVGPALEWFRETGQGDVGMQGDAGMQGVEGTQGDAGGRRT